MAATATFPAADPSSSDTAPDPTVARGVLVATILASSMVFIDGSVVNVALPTLQR